MAYGIFRVEKRHTIGGLQAENNRSEGDHIWGERDFVRSDIDWDKTHENIYFVESDNWTKSADNLIQQYNCRTRSDSVKYLDAIFTASPEFFEDKPTQEITDYFRNCLDWYRDEMCQGKSDRIINAVVHLDERTPHMHVISVPIVEREGRRAALSAKSLCGSNRDYRERQNRFYEDVSSRYGLDRGEIRDWGEIRQHRDSLRGERDQLQRQVDAETWMLNTVREARQDVRAELEDLTRQREDLRQQTRDLQKQHDNIVQRFMDRVPNAEEMHIQYEIEQLRRKVSKYRERYGEIERERQHVRHRGR